MSTLSVIVPQVKQAFGILDVQIGILSAFMLYVYAPMQLVVGYFIDKFGAKSSIIFGLITIGIGSLIFALAPDANIGFLGRAIVGLGASSAFVCITYVPPHYFRKERVNFLVCLAIGLALLGPIFSQTILPYMVSFMGWRMSLVILGVAPIVCGICAIVFLRKVKEESSNHNPFKFFWSICKKPQTWVIAFTAAFFYVISSTFGYLWGVPYFVKSGGYSIHMAGLLTTTIFAGGILFAPQIGHLSDNRYSPKSMILFLSMLASLLFSIMLLFSLPLWLLFLFIFVIGVCAVGENLCYVLAFQEHSHSAKGMAVGITNFIIILITSIFQPLVGGLIQVTGNIKGVMWIFPIMLISTFIMALFLRGNKRDSQRKVG
jgi:MFS family permease